MSIGDELRRVERARHSRNVQIATFKASTAGLLHVPHPSTLQGQGTAVGRGGEVIVGAAPIGGLIRLTVEGFHAGSGGTPIVWTDLEGRRHGFDDLILPGAVIPLEFDAVYELELWLLFHHWTGGGQIQWRWGDQIQSPPDWGTKTNMFGPLPDAIIGHGGEGLSVWIDHDSPDDEDLDAVLQVSVKERLKGEVPPDAPPPGAIVSASAQTITGQTTLHTPFWRAPVAGEQLLIGFSSAEAGRTYNVAGFTTVEILNSGSSSSGRTSQILSKTADGSEGTSITGTVSGGSASRTVRAGVIAPGMNIKQSGTEDWPTQPGDTSTPDVGTMTANQVTFMWAVVGGTSGGITFVEEPEVLAMTSSSMQRSGRTTVTGSSVRTLNTLAVVHRRICAVRLGP